MGLWLCVVCILVLSTSRSQSSAINLDGASFKDVLKKHDFILVNFYAEWCRFSRDLAPIFDAASETAAQEFKDGNVLLARVDCDKQGALCMEQGVTKYPTLKLFKFGQRYHSEYRNQRSVEAFVAYLKEQVANPLKVLSSTAGLTGIESKRSMVGIFPAFSKENEVYSNFYKVAHHVTDCTFYGIEDKSTNASIVKFVLKKNSPSSSEVNKQQEEQSPSSPSSSVLTEGLPTLEVLADFGKLREWAVKVCTPYVRELTFANAEEITEPRLPLLILFYPPGDNDRGEASYIQRFTSLMEQHLANYSGKIVPLTADGNVFSHPLMHMGKTIHDLPILAIDSFQHMFLYPGDLNAALTDPKYVNQFILDLRSEKLHRQFHGVTEKAPVEQNAPPPQESVFKLLTPSGNRYSIIKDEL
ncbi:hypothetical protein Aperf_G00000109138 [Anoplocephala perfoliata]